MRDRVYDMTWSGPVHRGAQVLAIAVLSVLWLSAMALSATTIIEAPDDQIREPKS